MRAGKLDRTITIQSLTTSVDQDGTPTPTWATVATVRAQIVQGSTEEFIRNGGADPESTVIFRVRWIGGLTTANRVLSNGAVYNVKELKEIGRRRGLEIRCTAPTGAVP